MFSHKENSNLLVGLEISDDAAVYKIDDNKAVILTLDFFTPVVDDPYSYGAIAAANALSDIYAMGGEVSVALNVCCFPADMEVTVIMDILQGGAEKVKEAGGVLAGGHTIDDKEPKYGLSVMGTAHPEKIMTKGGARPGDLLILTKPLGTGIITTAAKADKAENAHINLAIRSMMKLSKTPSGILRESGIRGCTDITGFGLLGHASEIAEKSGTRLNIAASALPFLPGARVYAENRLFPGGTNRNMKAYKNNIVFHDSIGEEIMYLMYTPETSGGLLAAVPPSKIDTVIEEFKREGALCRIIGEVVEGKGIKVVP